MGPCYSLPRMSASVAVWLLLFLREGAAHAVGAGRIYCRGALFNMADDTFLVHDEGSACSKALFFTVDAVGFRNCALEIAE
jgi:hypothetical protein